MRTIVVFISMVIGLCLMTHAAYAAVPSVTPAEPFTSEPVENQIIVKYKKDLSPQMLQIKVEERKVQKSRFLGSIRLFIDNLKYRLNKQTLPEESYANIQRADEQAGVENKSRIFDADDQGQRNLFLVTTNGNKSLEETVKIFEALPEVEYAEPNYTATIQNY